MFTKIVQTLSNCDSPQYENFDSPQYWKFDSQLYWNFNSPQYWNHAIFLSIQDPLRLRLGGRSTMGNQTNLKQNSQYKQKHNRNTPNHNMTTSLFHKFYRNVNISAQMQCVSLSHTASCLIFFNRKNGIKTCGQLQQGENQIFNKLRMSRISSQFKYHSNPNPNN